MVTTIPHHHDAEPHPMRDLVGEMALTGVIAFVVAAATTWVYTMVVHNVGVVGWDTALLLAVICGVALPLAHRFAKKREDVSG